MHVPQKSTVEVLRDRIVGLHELALFLAQHPEVVARPYAYGAYVIAGDAADYARLVRALKDGAPLGSIERSARPLHMVFARRFGPDVVLEVLAARSVVCERVQVGTRTVERPKVVGTETVEEPVYEWRCEPVLAQAEGERPAPPTTTDDDRITDAIGARVDAAEWAITTGEPC